jgi:hypothetical protein
MDSQRGKASSNASRQNKSQKPRQASKSQTYAGNNNNNNLIQNLNKIINKNINKPKPNRNRNNNNRRGQDLSNTMLSSGPLGLSSGNRGKTRKTHLIDEDEYIADINGSVAFATTQYPINPGQSGTFPWGNKIASLYEKYSFQYLEFYYRREVSEFATNGQAGKVMLSCDYDASDGAPTTKQQVLDTDPHVDGMPCTERISLVIDVRQMQHQDGCYVRPGTQPANTDIKTYDAGNFFISTYGNTNTSTIGELRVRYKCLVSVPVLESGVAQTGQPGSYLQITSALSGETAAATTVFAPLFASSTNPVQIGNGIGATVASTGLITLLAGSYIIECSATMSDSAASVSAGHLYPCQVVTAATDNVLSSANAGVEVASDVNNVNGHQSFFVLMAPFVWNTTQFGTTFCLQAAATYASGTCLNQGYLKITQL